MKSVSAGGTESGRNPEALTDGETLNSRNEHRYEWRAVPGGEERAFCEFDFGEKKGIDCIYTARQISDRREALGFRKSCSMQKIRTGNE